MPEHIIPGGPIYNSRYGFRNAVPPSEWHSVPPPNDARGRYDGSV